MQDSKRPISSLSRSHIGVAFVVGTLAGIFLGPSISDFLDQPLMAPPGPFAGQCTRIIDADSIIVTTKHHGNYIVHLVSANAPDVGEKSFAPALQFTTKSLLNQDVTVDATHGEGRGEVTAWVYAGPRCFNNDLVKAGFARYSGGDLRDAPISVLEDEARKAQRGLWSDPRPKEIE